MSGKLLALNYRQSVDSLDPGPFSGTFAKNGRDARCMH